MGLPLLEVESSRDNPYRTVSVAKENNPNTIQSLFISDAPWFVIQ